MERELSILFLSTVVGHVGSFDEFIHDVTRPHPGQIQAARNIRDMVWLCHSA